MPKPPIPMERKAYYIPKELAEWVEKEARKDMRSASGFLSALLMKVKNG